MLDIGFLAKQDVSPVAVEHLPLLAWCPETEFRMYLDNRDGRGFHQHNRKGTLEVPSTLRRKKNCPGGKVRLRRSRYAGSKTCLCLPPCKEKGIDRAGTNQGLQWRHFGTTG